MGSFTDPGDLNPRPKSVDSLRRFFGTSPLWWPLNNQISSSWPLYLYYKYLKHIGQYNIARDLYNFLNHITRRKTFLCLADELRDDYIRKLLKQLHAYCFPKVFSKGPSFMMLCHLHSLTGKAPYNKEGIIHDIENWVSDSIDGRKKHLDMDVVDKCLKDVFSEWKKPSKKIPFKEYCNDFLRWGTNGGAPRSDIFGSKYRTKWAWAYSKSTRNGDLWEGRDLYTEALKETDVCNVALKEESQKTRAVITTPMASYLRQSYLLYKWGKPKIHSPISDPTWIAKFESASPKWYGSIDGEKFDHSIPADVILKIIDKFGDYDDETRVVADEELLHLNNLKIMWAGTEYNWRGGLLSGWRITSIVGSLISRLAAKYIEISLGLQGAIEYGVMGDDLILYSNISSVSADDLVVAYTRFGLKANITKTASGPVGEFLRKVVSYGGSWGYPALSLRSIVYANPWVQKYTYEREVEVSSSWLTFLSRLLPHSCDNAKVVFFFRRDLCYNLSILFGAGKWQDWISTPISAGGGGCQEIMGDNWLRLEHIRNSSFLDTKYLIPELLGIIKSKTIFSSVARFIPINIRRAVDIAKQALDPSLHSPFPNIKDDVSKTDLIFYIAQSQKYSIKYVNSCLNFSVPRNMRSVSSDDMLKYLLMGSSAISGLTSITHSKELVSLNSSLSKFISRSVMISRRFSNRGILLPAMTIYFMMTYKDLMVPYGTW